MKIAIIGCGDIGTRCARLLVDEGHCVTGARRNVASLPSWLTAVQANVVEPDSLSFLHAHGEQAFDVVIYVLAATGFGEKHYRLAYVDGVKNTLEALRVRPPQRLFFVSSTGVYHQNDGSVVNEKSPTEPTRFNGQLVLQGEELVRRVEFGTCVRFSGIYGPDRLRLINRVASGQSTRDDSPPFTNRIHIEDCAGVLAHLVRLVARGADVESIYLASDCLPATSVEVESFIAETLGVERHLTAPLSRARRIAGSKRCDNQRLLDSGYVFKYPDYKVGYRQVIHALRSTSNGQASQGEA